MASDRWSCSSTARRRARPTAPNPTMYPIAEAGPFYAALMTGGNLDTKGGPKTTPDGKVLDTSDRPIAGLYGVGNCVASASARAYWAGGATLGPILAFSYLAAKAAHAEPVKQADADAGRRRIKKQRAKSAANRSLQNSFSTGGAIHGVNQADDDQRTAQVRRGRISEGFRQRRRDLRRRQHPRSLRQRRAGLFPKWGVARGTEQIGKLFGDVGGTLKSIVHHYSNFNWIFSGEDLVVAEGTSHGEHRDGAMARRRSRTSGAAAGATSSKSATGRSSGASSISTPTTPARTPRAIRG